MISFIIFKSVVSTEVRSIVTMTEEVVVAYVTNTSGSPD
jgi:hypothetical protein